MTIYADQMFIENFIMNFIILYITAKLCNIEWKWYKLSLGSGVGALYVIFSYIFGFYSEPLITAKILLSVIIVILSYFPKRFSTFFKELLYFYAVTFFIGGASFGLSYFFNISTISEGGILYVEEFPVIMVAIGAVAAFILGKYTIYFIKNILNIKELLYKVEIQIRENILETVVFYDSGHNVREPFTNYPVVIIQKDVLAKIISEDILGKLEENNFDFSQEWKERVRIIPISTVNSESGILKGFKADSLTIFKNNEKIYLTNVIVVFCDKNFSKDNSYFGLIGRI